MEKPCEKPVITPEESTEENTKLPYEAPRLVIHGKIEKLTLAS